MESGRELGKGTLASEESEASGRNKAVGLGYLQIREIPTMFNSIFEQERSTFATGRISVAFIDNHSAAVGINFWHS